MKQQIDKLIANALLDEGEVYLPGKGSLILRRQAAMRLSSKKLQLPYRELVFTSEERGINLIALISKVANVSEERASDIFTEWLTKSSRVQSPTRRSLIISGVCTITTYEVESRSTANSYRGEKSTITTDKTFETMANPKGQKVKKVNPRPKYFIYIFTSVLVGIALGVSATYFYLNGSFDELLKNQSIIPTSDVLKVATATVEPATEPTAAVTEETTTEVTTEEVVAETPAESDSEVVEQPTEQVAEQGTEQPDAPVVEPAAEPTAEESDKFEIKHTQKGHSYAVWGQFRDIKNTKKAIAKLAEEHPEIECNLYHYGAQHILTVYESASRAECNKKVAELKKENKNFRSVWVFTQK